jgi:hypothetical protein
VNTTKTKKEIEQHIQELNVKLNDALENPKSEYDSNDLQVALDELRWVLR